MARTTVNEGSDSRHYLEFFDDNDNPVTPEAIRYRLMGDDGVEFISWTSITVDSTYIKISAAMNTVHESGGGLKRYLTVEATHSGGEVLKLEENYILLNLKGVDPI